jgi:hypothetical protein
MMMSLSAKKFSSLGDTPSFHILITLMFVVETHTYASWFTPYKVLMVKHVSKKCHNNFGGAKSLVVIFSSFVNLLTKLISLSLKHIKRLLNELLNL